MVKLVFIYALAACLTCLMALSRSDSQFSERKTISHKTERGFPWRYRVLDRVLVDKIAGWVEPVAKDKSIALGYIILTVIGMTAAGLAANLWWRDLGVSEQGRLFLAVILAYSFVQMENRSTLIPNTYLDCAFVFLALSAMRDRNIFIVPLVILAALNRETSWIIPVAGFVLFGEFAMFAIVPWMATYVGLLAFCSWRGVMQPYGMDFGLDTIWFNLTDFWTYAFVAMSFLIVPVVSLMNFKNWTPELRKFAFCCVPLVAMIIGGGMWAETRIWLVPWAGVILPGLIKSEVA